jgi:hypothetical protein
MNFKEISIYTLIPEIYKIINYNNDVVKNYVGSFYDGSINLLKAPLSTTGSINAAKGEFTTVVTDNLIVKKQYSNLYENVTTSNYDWYNTYISGYTMLRDASKWEVAGFKYLDVDKPYYKIQSGDDVAPRCSNLSQVVELFIDDPSAINICRILLDPSGNEYTTQYASEGENVKLICVAYDASYGSRWVVMGTSGAGAKAWTSEAVTYVP